MLRLRLKTLVRTEFWFWGVLFLVFVNTALRCTIHYGMPQWWEDTLYRAEVAFLVIFTLETMLKQGSQRAKIYTEVLKQTRFEVVRLESAHIFSFKVQYV